MTQYLISLYHPDGPTPPPEFLEPVMRKIQALNDEMKTAGVWVFAAGLHPPTTATVLRATENGQIATLDGPYLEGKEHLGGFTIVEVPDLDAALDWGRRVAEITYLPVEVRPFQGVDDPSCVP
ncbi:YciI family protein [Amycolatopsis sp. NPDC102389]|uniref:YciI family protein n=1 Tax=Amycolatopsis sp. NPDC102389 TaxID=3363941 RepID=UPI003800C9D8